jgi:hypothetical protein
MASPGRSVRAGARALALLFGATPLAPLQAETPACSAAIAGQLSRQVTVQCVCRYFVASDLAGTPAGYRWDCGILQARLNAEVPVDLSPYLYPLPEALSLELPLPGEPGALPPYRR